MLSSQPKVTAAARNALSRPVPARAHSSGVKIAEIIAMKRLQQVALRGVRRRLLVRGRAAELGDLADLGEDLGHLVADDDLVLAAGLGRGDDAGRGLHGRLVDLGVVLDDETQPGRAVHERGDVLLAADALENRSSGLGVIHRIRFTFRRDIAASHSQWQPCRSFWAKKRPELRSPLNGGVSSGFACLRSNNPKSYRRSSSPCVAHAITPSRRLAVNRPGWPGARRARSRRAVLRR